MKLTITEKHLDLALSKPWATQTCLVAQAIAEYAKSPVLACGHGNTMTQSNRHFHWPDAAQISREFDGAFAVDIGKPDQAIIDSIRAKLPLQFEVEELKS